MAQSDDKSKRGKDQPGKPAGGDAAPRAAQASKPAKNAREELANASHEYNRAVYQAWLHAAEESGKAHFELAAAQHRVVQETSAQRAAAYFNWLRAVQDGSADTAGDALKEAHEGCSKAFEETAKAGRSGLIESQQNHQRMLGAASEAYATATQEALNAYLSSIKAIWGSIDFADADPQTLASLASASAHAVRAVQPAS
jgi:hypothetical protein